MGNFLQSYSAVDADVKIPPMALLTKEEIRFIQETWKIPSANIFDSAELIFYTFLERFPENQKSFSAFKDVPLASLKGTAGFRNHASRIFNVFSAVIDALGRDDLKGVKDILVESGKFHGRKRVNKKPMLDVRDVLLEILTDMCKLDEAGKRAYSKLMDIFFHILLESMDGRVVQFQ